VHPNWPLRWPADWHDPASLEPLKDTPIGVLLIAAPLGYEAVINRARELGIRVCVPDNPPQDVRIVKGEWPGIRMSSGSGDASSGPTGAPWIDSNGWLIRLTRAQQPARALWVTADLPKTGEIVPLSRHLVALADSAAHGGRWVLTPDRELMANVDAWRKLMRAVEFHQAHEAWNDWSADAVLAVVSSFAGADEFFSHEVLNLMARTNISYAIVEKTRATAPSFRGLRAALYVDTEPPEAAGRQLLLDFAERGGLLITAPSFGKLPGLAAAVQSHPRYQLRSFGKGTIAVALAAPADPYEVAQDAQILLSHRYDRMRFFNGFLLGGYRTVSADGKRSLAHVINYGGGAGDDLTSARLAGRYRSAKLWTCESPAPRQLEMVSQRDGIELHLPQLDVYGAIELEAAEHA
jgi:hypothetical protein